MPHRARGSRANLALPRIWRDRMKWLGRAVVLVLLLALLVAAAGWIYSRRVLPQTDGSLSLAGPHAPIRIERDAQGIPTVKAGSIEDAMFGLGFVHAQDRLWQLETHRRMRSGRAAWGLRRAAAEEHQLPPGVGEEGRAARREA